MTVNWEISFTQFIKITSGSTQIILFLDTPIIPIPKLFKVHTATQAIQIV